ncbi:MAG: MATE family efflux transporter [Clostridium fessum]
MSISIVVLLFDRPLLQIFNITGESLRRAKEHLDILMFFIWTSTITNITCGFLQGAGDVKIPAASGFINSGHPPRALPSLLALTPVGFRCYYVSMPPAWLIACFVVVMRYRSGKWRSFGL